MQTISLQTDVQGIHGLTIAPDYLSEREEKDLLALVDQQVWSTELKRRVQHYGYRYDYKRRQAGADRYMGGLPGWLMPLATRVYESAFIALVPDQCAINEYLPGQGIASHVDCVPCFGDTVIAISLGSRCVMEFTSRLYPVKIPVLLEPRSLMVMTGASRYDWKHGIPPRKTDRYYGREYPRFRRVSVTFRKHIEGGSDHSPLK